ncbi:hypothetical protein [Acidithiobacillus ferrivorans]|uniref:Uncharacterized protein n=2 Tax=Acidithiobacillus ferrivorans TaxID=160808 RepID=A0A060UP63_9PROT|nr:hypothetical protein [Acidithiobacillus ferrivorans]CDQ08588.1 hypothetical protein AFERRI_100023 [Acidithiobacillus ferrivorans]
MNRNAGVKGASCGISVGAQCVIGIPKKVLDGHGLLGQIDLDCLGGRFAMIEGLIFITGNVFLVLYAKSGWKLMPSVSKPLTILAAPWVGR